MAPGRAIDYVAAEVSFTWGLCCSVSLAEKAKRHELNRLMKQHADVVSAF